jgi:protein involved in polysaccharide export with SLBB domain
MSERCLRFAVPTAVSLALTLLGGTLVRAQEVSVGAVDGAREIRLGPGDIVRLQVFLEQGLASIPGLDLRAPMEYDVDAEGMAFIPVVGPIRVAGRDFAEVRSEISRAVEREFATATLRVTPVLRIAVLGEVRAPRLVPVDPTITVPDLIAAVGGLTEMADRDEIRLVRGGQVVLDVSADELVAVQDRLQSGDRITVGRRSWVSTNTPFLLGAGASVLAAVLTSLLLR